MSGQRHDGPRVALAPRVPLALLALAALCAAVAPRMLGAQGAAGAAGAACAVLPPAVDSTSVTLHAVVGPWSDDPLRHTDLRANDGRPTRRPTAAEAGALALLLQELVRATRWPPSMPYSLTQSTLFGYRDSTRAGRLSPDVDPQLAFTLHADGRVTRLVLERPSSMPSLDAALAAGLSAAADSGHFAGLLTGLGRDSMRLLLHTTEKRDTAAVARPLLQMQLPLYEGAPVAVWPPVRPLPYPERAQHAGVQDSIEVRFVVDTAGRVERTSIQLVHGVYRDFIRAVLDELPQLRYTPARIGACPVRLRVQQPFVYKLR